MGRRACETGHPSGGLDKPWLVAPLELPRPARTRLGTNLHLGVGQVGLLDWSQMLKHCTTPTCPRFGRISTSLDDGRTFRFQPESLR